jgi:hypothetical protein
MWTHTPNEEEERSFPDVTELVRKFMIHENTPRCLPHGRQLHSGQRCSFGSPKPPILQTHCETDGNWVTWHPAADANVAAYNPALLLGAHAHAFIEAKSGMHAIGYLLAY